MHSCSVLLFNHPQICPLIGTHVYACVHNAHKHIHTWYLLRLAPTMPCIRLDYFRLVGYILYNTIVQYDTMVQYNTHECRRWVNTGTTHTYVQLAVSTLVHMNTVWLHVPSHVMS